MTYYVVDRAFGGTLGQVRGPLQPGTVHEAVEACQRDPRIDGCWEVQLAEEGWVKVENDGLVLRCSCRSRVLIHRRGAP